MMRKFIKTTLKIYHVFIVHDVVVEMESFREKKHIIKIQTKEIRKECISILNFVFNIRFTMIYWKSAEKGCLNACQKYKYWNMNVINNGRNHKCNFCFAHRWWNIQVRCKSIYTNANVWGGITNDCGLFSNHTLPNSILTQKNNVYMHCNHILCLIWYDPTWFRCSSRFFHFISLLIRIGSIAWKLRFRIKICNNNEIHTEKSVNKPIAIVIASIFKRFFSFADWLRRNLIKRWNESIYNRLHCLYNDHFYWPMIELLHDYR